MPIPENLSLFHRESEKGRLSGMHSAGKALRAEKNLTGAEASGEEGKNVKKTLCAKCSISNK